jgi:hypothetical protein
LVIVCYRGFLSFKFEPCGVATHGASWRHLRPNMPDWRTLEMNMLNHVDILSPHVPATREFKWARRINKREREREEKSET